MKRTNGILKEFEVSLTALKEGLIPRHRMFRCKCQIAPKVHANSMLVKYQFSMRTLLFTISLTGICVAWYISRQQIKQEIESLKQACQDAESDLMSREQLQKLIMFRIRFQIMNPGDFVISQGIMAE